MAGAHGLYTGGPAAAEGAQGRLEKGGAHSVTQVVFKQHPESHKPLLNPEEKLCACTDMFLTPYTCEKRHPCARISTEATPWLHLICSYFNQSTWHVTRTQQQLIVYGWAGFLLLSVSSRSVPNHLFSLQAGNSRIPGRYLDMPVDVLMPTSMSLLCANTSAGRAAVRVTELSPGAASPASTLERKDAADTYACCPLHPAPCKLTVL